MGHQVLYLFGAPSSALRSSTLWNILRDLNAYIHTDIHTYVENIPTNCFSVLNGKIPLLWFNYSTDRFKINVKKLLLWSMTTALICQKFNISRDHKLKFIMYIICKNLSQINHSKSLTYIFIDICVVKFK